MGKTTGDFLDEYKRAIHLRFDAELGRAWGITPGAIGRYRGGYDPLPEYRIARIVEVLKIDPEEIYRAQAIERAKRSDDPRDKALVKMLREIGLAGVMLATYGLGTPAPSHAASAGNLDIMSNRRKRSRDGSRAADQPELALI